MLYIQSINKEYIYMTFYLLRIEIIDIDHVFKILLYTFLYINFLLPVILHVVSMLIFIHLNRYFML